MLVDQGRELERTRAELDKARAALGRRELIMAESGSIAQAALQLNDVFEAAQAAADQYVESVCCAADRRARHAARGAK